MKNLVLISTAACSIAFSQQSAADDFFDKVSPLSVGVGLDLVSGVSVEVSHPINDYLSVRGSLSLGADFNEDLKESDIDYNVKSEGAINRIAVDYHPFQNGFFASGGIGLSSFKLKPTVKYQQDDTLQINNITYQVTSPTAGLNGSYDWNSAPSLSIGWGHSSNEGFGFLAEIGVLLTGAPGVSLDGYGTVKIAGTPGGSTEYDLAEDDDNIVSDEEANLREDAKNFEVLPIIRVGITYCF